MFFVISGFLLPWAFARRPVLREFARNRLLRVYPALWFAFAVTVAVLVAHEKITLARLGSRTLLAWFAGQLTFAQFYTAPELRSYGLGNPNGSLWTIVVELQFYVMVPLIIGLWRRLEARRTAQNLGVASLALASLAFNVWLGGRDHERIANKLLAVSLAPYLFYFLLGTLAYLNWDRLERFVRGRALPAIAAFALYSWIASHRLGLYAPSYWPRSVAAVVAILLLAWATLAVAYTAPRAAERLLRGQDLSYGLYVFHAIVLNLLFEHGRRSPTSLLSMILGALALAAVSWWLVEKPALRRKRTSGGRSEASHEAASASVAIGGQAVEQPR